MDQDAKITKSKFIIGLIAGFLIVSIILGSIIALIINLSLDQTETKQFQSLTGKFTDIKVTDADSAVAAAKDAANFLGLENAAEELTLKSENTVDGITYYRLQQNYNNIEVCGRSIVVIADENGETKGCTTNMIDIKKSEINIINLSEEEIVQKIASFLNLPKSQIHIVTTIQKIDNMQTLSLYYDTWISFEEDENVYLYNLYVPVEDTNVSYGNLELNPYNICQSNDGQTFKGTKIYDNDNKKDCYLMYNLEDNLYCLTANGNITYSYKNQNHIKNSSLAISSPSSRFAKEYNFAFSVANDLQKIKKWYIDEYNDDAFGGIALIMDSGTGTVGGLLPTNTMDALKLSNYQGENVGCVQIGKDDQENLTFKTLAHEYTHVISRNIVNWIVKSDYSMPDEYTCINEAYSDLFGMILDSKINNKAFVWNSRTDISTMQGYPKKVNSLKTRITSGKIGGGDAPVKALLVDIPGDENDIPYMYAYAVTLQYAAYLMNTAKVNNLTIDEIEHLWYNTLLTLPSNCTFSAFRKNMEMTAKIIGFSDNKIARISAAFDEVGIYNENDNSVSEYSTGISVQALTSFDGDIKPTSQYKIIIEGKEDKPLWFTKNYYKSIDVTNNNPINLTLEKGEYTISVTDGNNTYSQKIKTRKGSKNRELTFITNFVYVVEIKTPDESDFESFVKMFEASSPVWNHNDSFTSENLTVTEIIDDYISNYMFCYYLTLFDSDTIIKEGKDPLNKLYSCRKIDGDKIDWILENIFNKRPDHNSSSKYHYYYDGNWYIEGAQGLGDDGIIVKSVSQRHEQIDGSKYKITIEYIFDNYFTGKTETWEYVFVTNFNYAKNKGNYWSIESLSKKQMASDSTSNSKPSAVITENSSAKEMREAIIGRWTSPTKLYVFNEDGSCKMLYDNSAPGTFEITDDKKLKIKMAWTSEKLSYDSNSLVTRKGWCFAEDGDLVIEGVKLKKQK